ncbi:hypothetical protein Scep_029779 [Stephania cephalantha]|uniref:Uncharacterized protein n=1 Tax=Stephania cephalantha TaxID=152367 RepID=A0AAP0HCM0_9MAGN
MPDSLPQVKRCAVGRIGDNRPSNASHVVRPHWTPAQHHVTVTFCSNESLPRHRLISSSPITSRHASSKTNSVSLASAALRSA